MLIQREPVEVQRYLAATDYKVMKACVEKVGERAICEIFMKLYECVMKDKQPAGVEQ